MLAYDGELQTSHPDGMLNTCGSLSKKQDSGYVSKIQETNIMNTSKTIVTSVEQCHCCRQAPTLIDVLAIVRTQRDNNDMT